MDIVVVIILLLQAAADYEGIAIHITAYTYFNA